MQLVSMTLIDTYIKESRFGNHLEAVAYWEEAKKAMPRSVKEEP
jgi:putative IMPACT (imprinted ancient) family translation regulator